MGDICVFCAIHINRFHGITNRTTTCKAAITVGADLIQGTVVFTGSAFIDIYNNI